MEKSCSTSRAKFSFGIWPVTGSSLALPFMFEVLAHHGAQRDALAGASLKLPKAPAASRSRYDVGPQYASCTALFSIDTTRICDKRVHHPQAQLVVAAHQLPPDRRAVELPLLHAGEKLRLHVARERGRRDRELLVDPGACADLRDAHDLRTRRAERPVREHARRSARASRPSSTVTDQLASATPRRPASPRFRS